MSLFAAVKAFAVLRRSTTAIVKAISAATISTAITASVTASITTPLGELHGDTAVNQIVVVQVAHRIFRVPRIVILLHAHIGTAYSF